MTALTGSDEPPPRRSDAHPAAEAATARVTLLVRPGCHLCEFARDSVARVSGDTGHSWAEVDVDQDPELAHEYGDRVPVVLVDGREHDYFRVDEARLRHALAGGTAGASVGD